MTTMPPSAATRRKPPPEAGVSEADFANLTFDVGGIRKMNVNAAGTLVASTKARGKGTQELTGAQILDIKQRLEQGKQIKGLDETQTAFLVKHIDKLEQFLRDYGQWFRADQKNDTFCWSFKPQSVPNDGLRECAEIVAESFGDKSILKARHFKTAADMLGWTTSGEVKEPRNDAERAALEKLTAAVAEGKLERDDFDVIDMFISNGNPPILQWDKTRINGSREFNLVYELPIDGDKNLGDMSKKERAALIAEYEDKFTYMGYDRIYMNYKGRLLLALNPKGSLGGRNGVRPGDPIEVKVNNTWRQDGEVLFVEDIENSVGEAAGRWWNWLFDKVFSSKRNIDSFTQEVYAERLKAAGAEPSKDNLKELISGPTIVAALVGISWQILQGLAVGGTVGLAASGWDVGKYLLTHRLDLRPVYNAIDARVSHDGPIQF